MGKIRYWIASIVILFISIENSVLAVELLNISSYSEGYTSLGENMIVGMIEKTGEKYLTGYNGKGKIQFPVNLSSKFEASIKIDCQSGNLDFFILSEESYIKAELLCFGVLPGANISLQGQSSDNSAWISKGKNDIKISVKDSTVRLYVNDAFSNKFTLHDGSLTYSKLSIGGLSEDGSLYEVNVTGSGGTTTDFEKGKQAGIQQCVTNPQSCGIAIGGPCEL